MRKLRIAAAVLLLVPFYVLVLLEAVELWCARRLKAAIYWLVELK